MKNLALFLYCCLFTSSAFATELLCASKKNQTIYFTDGQVRLTAKIAGNELLENVDLSITGNPDMGSQDESVKGKSTSKYTRFELYGDHVCSYRIALPKDFSSKETTPLFLDSFCEENYNDTVTLNCRVKQ